MKLKTQMKACGILTCQKGILQAQKNGVLYQEFVPMLYNYNFAGDAKQIFEAMSLLQPNFRVLQIDEEQILFVDEVQEIKVDQALPDEIIEIPCTFEVESAQDIYQKLKALKPFVTQDFPAFFFKEHVIEALHPSMVVLTKNPITALGAFSADSLPSGCTGVVETDKGLWLKYGDGVVLLGRLELEIPDTTGLVVDQSMQQIPPRIKKRWIDCTQVTFCYDRLILDTHSVIEGIRGSGVYDGALFKKVITNASYWSFSEKLLHFSCPLVIGVLENEQ